MSTEVLQNLVPAKSVEDAFATVGIFLQQFPDIYLDLKRQVMMLSKEKYPELQSSLCDILMKHKDSYELVQKTVEEKQWLLNIPRWTTEKIQRSTPSPSLLDSLSEFYDSIFGLQKSLSNFRIRLTTYIAEEDKIRSEEYKSQKKKRNIKRACIVASSAVAAAGTAVICILFPAALLIPISGVVAESVGGASAGTCGAVGLFSYILHEKQFRADRLTAEKVECIEESLRASDRLIVPIVSMRAHLVNMITYIRSIDQYDSNETNLKLTLHSFEKLKQTFELCKFSSKTPVYLSSSNSDQSIETPEHERSRGSEPCVFVATNSEYDDSYSESPSSHYDEELTNAVYYNEDQFIASHSDYFH